MPKFAVRMFASNPSVCAKVNPSRPNTMIRLKLTAPAVSHTQGVPPDIEVWDLPEVIAQGGDPSIEKAVEVLLSQLDD